MIELYNSIKITPPYLKGDDSTILRVDYVPRVRSSDIETGYFSRYFAQVSNQSDGEIVEIHPNQFLSISTIPLYRTVEILWKIRGPLADSGYMLGVLNANKKSVSIGNEVLVGLNRKLTNYREFYQGL